MAHTTEITSSGQSTGTIHCLTIPLHGETALLPNAAIAEVIGYKQPVPLSEAPEWFLGHIDWRDKKVPIISFEGVSGKDVQAPIKNSRIAVLNTLNANPQLPYIGILSQGIPSLAIVKDQELQDEGEPDDSRQTVGGYIKLAGIKALIPNIDEIENRLSRLNLF